MHVRYLQHQHQGTVQLLLMPLNTAAAGSVKNSKWLDDGDESDCDAVPLPIQTFLWRQTNPFLGAKIGKLHEASCVTFERVVVQNILHGLSPSLSDAIASVSRWKLIRAALPHVIQCCGSLLEASENRCLSTSLQKILYILHWMLLDAAAECAEVSSKDDINQQNRGQGLFSISSIQLFVYIIAPLADTVSEADISSNIRLESGLKIWQALWQNQQMLEANCRRIILGIYLIVVLDNNSLSGVFGPQDAPIIHISDICSGFSQEINENLEIPVENCQKVTIDDRTLRNRCEYKEAEKSTVAQKEIPQKETSPLVLAKAPSNDDTVSSSSQHTVIHNQPQPSHRERVDLHKVDNGRLQNGFHHFSLYLKLHVNQYSTATKSNDTDSADDSVEDYGQPDPMIATILDVAVIRALLITHWHEQGIHWAMRYLLNRLEQIQNHFAIYGTRNRSNSLPPGERKPSVAIGLPSCYTSTTWENFQLKQDENDRSKLHVAFNDSRSDPSLNNSCEILSIREDNVSVSNVSTKSERQSGKIAAKFYPEVLGSSSFIEKDGKISLTVIVKTINQVMERNCVANLCELALNIADTVLRIPSDQTEIFFPQLTTMIFRIYLTLGCPHGCNDGMKSQQGNFLRVKAKNILAQLEKLHQDRFRSIFVTYVEENNPQQILDLIHSITAFCRSEFLQETRRVPENKAPSYRNRFNEREKGIEGRIINATLRNLTTKLATIQDQLVQPENMSLLGDVRMLVNFIQDQHGNPFRRVALSALSNAVEKATKLERSISLLCLRSFESARKDESGKSSPGGLAPPSRNDQASLRRGLFKRREKSSHDSMLKSGAEDSDADSSPSTPRTISSIDDGLFPLMSATILKKKSTPKLHFAFNLLKSSRTENMDEECSDSETADDISEIDVMSAKKISCDSVRRPTGKSPVDGTVFLLVDRGFDEAHIFKYTFSFYELLDTFRLSSWKYSIVWLNCSSC
ncbi:hypothetical protein DICVIV_02354 [Dictyocaulus viviparus]|uniref:Cation channel complex component UNC80 N-terminal domain-containing protein n=1 Tax=Dictyocaulus viviparus TaxID=29172 RepID=A0A0D8Y3J6_DICVI|nr:hypothetical protein DICVIV_02354 [Dictyocaulus viviparus]